MFAILTIAFTLIFFAAISIIWQLIKGVILLPFKIIFRIWFQAPPTVRDYYAEDESAIWLKDEKGRYFRYDLSNPFDDKQMDDFNEFYSDYLVEKELKKMKEKVNV